MKNMVTDVPVSSYIYSFGENFHFLFYTHLFCLDVLQYAHTAWFLFLFWFFCFGGIFLVHFYFLVLRIEPRTLFILCMHFTTELHSHTITCNGKNNQPSLLNLVTVLKKKQTWLGFDIYNCLYTDLLRDRKRIAIVSPNTNMQFICLCRNWSTYFTENVPSSSPPIKERRAWRVWGSLSIMGRSQGQWGH